MNILIFMTDQQRGDSIQNPLIPTPNLDKFRSEGITFTEAYCPSPHCCPSRTSFFTGLYPTRHGVWNNVDVANALSRTPKEEVGYFSDILKSEGYTMDFSGKWHVSSIINPGDIGWNLRDYQDSTKVGLHTLEQQENEKLKNWEDYKISTMDVETDKANDGEIVRPGYPRYKHYGDDENPFNDITVVDEAVNIIQERAERKSNSPWIQFVGLLGPHDPYKVPAEYLEKINIDDITLPQSFEDGMKDKPGFYRRIRDVYKKLTPEQHKEALRHYYAFCAFLDTQFGRVLNALNTTNQDEDTLVLYVSDHGDYAAEHGLWTKGLAGFKGAYNIPAIVRWPNGIKNPGREINELISLVDFAPTFLEVANCSHRNPHKIIDISSTEKGPIPMAGKSLLPFFNDEKPKWRQELYTQSNGNELYGIQRIVFDKKYKFIFNGFDYDELYDLEKDPHEIVNLIPEGELGRYQEVIKKYYKKMWVFARENGDQYNNTYINTAYPTYGPGSIFQ